MIDLSIQFLPGGEVVAKVASPFIVMTVKPGRWNFEPAGGDRRRTTKAAGESAMFEGHLLSSICPPLYPFKQN